MTSLRWGSSALFIMVNLHRKPRQRFFAHIALDPDLLQIDSFILLITAQVHFNNIRQTNSSRWKIWQIN